MADKSNAVYPKLIKNNKVSEPLPKIPLTFWITASSKNGLIFTTNGTPSITTLLASDIHNKSSDIKQKSTTLFNSDCSILQIQCSCTGEYISIISAKANEYFIHIYDTKTFSFEFNDKPFPLYVENVGECNPLDFKWNPAIEGTFAYTTSGSRIYCFEFNLGDVGLFHRRIGELQSVGNCISWSPKGKQLVVGCADGSMAQYKPDLTLVRKESCPIIDGENELECVGICWLGTTDFVFAFEGKKSQNLNVSLLILKKNQPAQWTHLGNICRNVEKTVEPVRFYFEYIVEWGLVIVASNNGLSVGFLEKEGDIFKQYEPPEDKDILLELNEKCEMPCLCGIVLDKSPRENYKEVVDGVTVNYNRLPVIMLYTSNGIIQSYWFITNDDKYKSINVNYEPIVLSKIRNGTSRGEVISEKPKQIQSSGISFDSKLTSTPTTTNFFSSTKASPAVSKSNISCEKPQTPINKGLSSHNTSMTSENEIKFEAKEMETKIKEQLQNKEKEVLKKVEEEVNLISKLETEKKKEMEEEELEKLRKVCGDLIAEYYSRKNINIVKIQAQENAINRINSQLSITNDESVKELLKTLKVVTVSQNKVLHWSQIVSEDIETLNETLVILQNKISYMKKNKVSAAETYYFDTKTRFDESEVRLEKVRENFTALTKAIELLNKKIESKGLMNNIAKLDDANVIGSEDQEYIQKVSRNIVRATNIAFRKLKLLNDKYTELKNLKEKKNQDEVSRSFLNQSTILDNSFILEKTYIGETENLFTTNRNKNKDFQNYLRKRCSKPVEKKFVETLPFMKNVVIKKDEGDVESTVKNVKNMLEKCLIVSRTVNSSFSENSTIDVYLTKEDVTKIRQDTLNEAKEYAADFKATLEMTRKLMAAEMPKIDFNPPKEDIKLLKKVEGNNTLPQKSIDSDAKPVELNKTANAFSNKQECLEKKNEAVNKTPTKVEESKSTIEKKVGLTGEVNITDSLSTTRDSETASLTKEVSIESTKSVILGEGDQDKNSSKSTVSDSVNSPTLSTKSVFTSDKDSDSTTPRKTVFGENSRNIETPKSPLLSDKSNTTTNADTPKSSLFGNISTLKNNENSPSSIFGGSGKTPTQQGSFFGGTGTTTTPSKSSIFGGSPTTPKQSVFGQSSFGGSQTSGQSAFGGSQSSSQSMFGGSQASSQSVFGGSKQSSPSVFGGSQQSTTSAFGGSQQSGQSVFGGSQQSGQSVFGGSQQSGQSVFGGSQSKSVFGGSAFGGSFSNTTTKPSQPNGGMNDGSNISTGFFNSMSGLGSQVSEKKNVFAQSAFGASNNTPKDNSAFSFSNPPQTNTFQQNSNAPKPGFFSSNSSSSFGSSNTAFAKPAFGGSSTGSFGTPANTSTFGKSAFGQSSFGQSSFSSFANKTGSGFGGLSNSQQQSTFGNSSTTNKGSSFTQWR
uniref:Nuclear pore complex protein Nup214 (inferred by orthology to a human protein) n=1 Tax=Strongyloides venezuelensis TaxID=75913 RepID=A0A0K0FML6_STRVS